MSTADTVRAFVRVAVAMAILAGTTVLAPPADAATCGTPGRSIIWCLNIPGDRVVTIRNGTYKGGTISAPHPATAGRHQGWLVLRAETPHGVVLDLSEKPLWLDTGSSRIMFVGFKFVNGNVVLRGASDIRFWYCDGTYPPEAWYGQWVAAGGGHDVSVAEGKAALERLHSPVPKALIIHGSQRVRVLGSDFHDVGDDAIFVGGGSTDVLVQGTRYWNVDEGTADPGYGGDSRGGAEQDLIHADGIEAVSFVLRFAMLDSYSSKQIVWFAQHGVNTDWRFENVWMADSPNQGIQLASANGYVNRGRLDRVRAFGNAQGFRWDILDGLPVQWPELHDSPLIDAPMTGVDLTAPPGVQLGGDGRLVDEAAAREHPQNPALVWRSRFPYGSWTSQKP